LTPYNIAFVYKETKEIVFIETITDFVFLVDILMNFRFAYVNEAFEVVTNKKKIAASYLRSWFLIDFLSILPVNLMFQYMIKMPDSTNLANYLGLFKLLRLFRLAKFLKERNKIS